MPSPTAETPHPPAFGPPPVRRAVLLCGLMFAFGLGALPVPGARAASLDEIKARGTMIVATEDSYKPFEYVENGTPMGLDHALLAILRRDAPFKIDQQIIPWSGLLAGVAAGKYDVALTAAVITPDRTKSLDFTLPIAESTQYYAVRADEARIKAIPDLAGKTAGVQAGGASFTALADLTRTLEAAGLKLGPVVQYTSYPEAYQDLANGRLDYVVNAAVNLASLVREQPRRFRMGEAVGVPAYAAWAVAKGNTALLDYLDAFMVKVRADGTLYALQEKWLGTTFKAMPDQPTR